MGPCHPVRRELQQVPEDRLAPGVPVVLVAHLHLRVLPEVPTVRGRPEAPSVLVDLPHPEVPSALVDLPHPVGPVGPGRPASPWGPVSPWLPVQAEVANATTTTRAAAPSPLQTAPVDFQLYFVPLALMIAPPSNACIKLLLRTYIVKGFAPKVHVESKVLGLNQKSVVHRGLKETKPSPSSRGLGR